LQFITKIIKKTIKKDGKFINISSIASNHGAHDEFAYSASKKNRRLLSRSL
jgi:NAD(P)-dependent dehydrogenase (short-subunit alcohol dehydrogenase family)